VPERSALVWKIKAFPGGKELLLRAMEIVNEVRDFSPAYK
jgi:hypothetical protein